MKQKMSFEEFKKSIIDDFKLAYKSRQASLLGRKEVLSGKGSFGIFGDGKELAQIGMAKVFKNGDFRSGYYRDQTFMMAINELTVQQMFAGLYGHADIKQEPHSGGRNMVNHFGTKSLNEDGSWRNLMNQKNSSSDLAPTASQMPRLVGLGLASKIYRQNKKYQNKNFSNKGNEVAFGTIGNASTAEGNFFESFNAIGVLGVPVIISVWDDDYGISVHNKDQITKENISEILKGFQKEKNTNGFEILKVKGWDYPSIIETYNKAEKIAREKHIPVLIHVYEVTQPQGHSTSGSHERYKDKKRLKWEKDFDCINRMEQWMKESNIITDKKIEKIKEEIAEEVKEAKKRAWNNYQNPIKQELEKLEEIIIRIAQQSQHIEEIKKISENLKLEKRLNPHTKNILLSAEKVLRITKNENISTKNELKSFINKIKDENKEKYNSELYSENEFSAIKIKEVSVEKSEQEVDGRIILRENFDQILKNKNEVVIFGEDSGKIGGVNQGLEGLQKKYGELRVSDTGIREETILGQAIGLAMRGFRPIAEIQYLDYLLYCYQTLSDDLSTLRYRSKGQQKAPVIIRTRGHRLEGIWHSGSPMGMILNGIKGVYLLVPRNMTKAAGFYNTMLESDDPAIIIECLNGYRSKENMPNNLEEIRTPLGIPEITKNGSDVTLVTYGSTWKIVMEAAVELGKLNISAEVIDVQTLIPFDINYKILESLKKTNRIIFIDEDVPGGATSFMMQQVIEKQNGYKYLDSKPTTITAKDHRPAYGTDGDFFSKPNINDIINSVYELMSETDPQKYQPIL